MKQMLDEFRRWQLWFPFAMVLIAAVSLYDTFLTIKFRDMMIYMEENPVGYWLMAICEGEVGLFIQLKLAGTMVVLLLLLWMKIRESRMTLPVTGSLASYQCWLMAYLTLA